MTSLEGVVGGAAGGATGSPFAGAVTAGALAAGPQSPGPRAMEPVGRRAAAALPRRNLRRMPPGDMPALSLELYLCGLIGYEDHALLAFPPELHPDYDRTVGALTGERAEPERPRDLIRRWEDQLAFEQAHGPGDGAAIDRARRILKVLRLVDTAAA